MAATVGGSKTCTQNVRPNITASVLTSLMALAPEALTVAQLHLLYDASRRVAAGPNPGATLSQVFILPARLWEQGHGARLPDTFDASGFLPAPDFCVAYHKCSQTLSLAAASGSSVNPLELFVGTSSRGTVSA
jgi:hypothetical protein